MTENEIRHMAKERIAFKIHLATYIPVMTFYGYSIGLPPMTLGGLYGQPWVGVLAWLFMDSMPIS